MRTQDSIYTYNMAGAPLLVIPCHDPVTWVAGLSEEGSPTGNTTVWTWGPSGPGQTRGLAHVMGPRPATTPPATSPFDLLKSMGSMNANPHIVLAYGLASMLDRDSALQQAMLDGLSIWKGIGNTLALLVPHGTQLAGFVNSYAEEVDVPLPDADTLEAIARNLKQGNDLPGDIEGLGRALLGVTAFQAEDGLARLAIRFKRMPTPAEAGEIKAQAINATVGLEFIPVENLPKWDEVMGLNELKDFILTTSKHPRSKGPLVLGPPGTGKTMSAKALAGARGVPLIMFNLSEVFAGTVGASEGNIRKALSVIKRIGPHVLVLDEIEKLIGGATQSDRSDGGVGTRVARELLVFLETRPQGIYVIGTCNNMEALPPEYTRAGRWNAVFFVDLPSTEERSSLLDLYAKKFSVDIKGVNPATTLDGWTGAEIESACDIADMRGTTLEESLRFVVPISRTMKEKIDGLRDWAKGRCVPASSETPAPLPKNLSMVKGSRKLGLGPNVN